MTDINEKRISLPVSITGVVESGQRLGRQLGFPTANQSIASGLDVPFGIYASTVEIDGVSFRAVSNVGIRPTVLGTVPNCESHIFDFSGDLYGKSVKTTLLAFLREERSFDSIDELKMQIERDARAAAEYLGKPLKTKDKD